MADLTDEQKAALIEGSDAKNAEDIKNEDKGLTAEGADVVDEPLEAEQKTTEATTLTKQFSNLKGETWEEYGQEVEKAYQNSFTEALRLKKELDEARRVLANLPVSQQGSDVSQQGDKSPDATTAVTNLTPELQYARVLMDRDMRTSFNSFSESYPQVKDEANFTKFRDAATPIGQAFLAVEGREPTYDELFPRIAAVLGWQPAETEGKRDQALKESLGGGGAVANQTKNPGHAPKVSEAQVDAYLRMFPAKSRPDAVKELEEALS